MKSEASDRWSPWKIALLHYSLTRFGLSSPILTESGKIGVADWSCLISSYLSGAAIVSVPPESLLFWLPPTSAHCLPSRWCHSCWRHSLVYAALQEQPGVRRQHSRATASKRTEHPWTKAPGSRLPDRRRFRRHLHSSSRPWNHAAASSSPSPYWSPHWLIVASWAYLPKHLHPGPYLGLCSQGNSVQGSSSVYTLITLRPNNLPNSSDSQVSDWDLNTDLSALGT